MHVMRGFLRTVSSILGSRKSQPHSGVMELCSRPSVCPSVLDLIHLPRLLTSAPARPTMRSAADARRRHSGQAGPPLSQSRLSQIRLAHPANAGHSYLCKRGRGATDLLAISSFIKFGCDLRLLTLKTCVHLDGRDNAPAHSPPCPHSISTASASASRHTKHALPSCSSPLRSASSPPRSAAVGSRVQCDDEALSVDIWAAAARVMLGYKISKPSICCWR